MVVWSVWEMSEKYYTSFKECANLLRNNGPVVRGLTVEPTHLIWSHNTCVFLSNSSKSSIPPSHYLYNGGKYHTKIL